MHTAGKATARHTCANHRHRSLGCGACQEACMHRHMHRHMHSTAFSCPAPVMLASLSHVLPQ